METSIHHCVWILQLIISIKCNNENLYFYDVWTGLKVFTKFDIFMSITLQIYFFYYTGI